MPSAKTRALADEDVDPVLANEFGTQLLNLCIAAEFGDSEKVQVVSNILRLMYRNAHRSSQRFPFLRP